MNFILIFLVLTLIFQISGNLLAKLVFFRDSKVYRILTYISVLIVSMLIVVVVVDYFKIKQVTGVLAGCLSYWFYFGTRIKNDIPKRENIYKLKRVLGVILMIVGGITLLFFIMALLNYNTPLVYLFVHFYIGISQLIFGYALKKKYPFILSMQKEKV